MVVALGISPAEHVVETEHVEFTSTASSPHVVVCVASSTVAGTSAGVHRHLALAVPTPASAASTAWPETLSTTHTRTVPLPPAATNTPGIRSVPPAVQGTSALNQVLLWNAVLERLGPEHLRAGHRLTGFVQDATGVTASFANGATARGLNAPLRGHKGSTLEGGVRVPTIAWWPGKIAPGSVSDAVAGTIDVLPNTPRGTIMRVTLPALANRVVERAPSTPPPSPRRR